jgi:exopolysaccharide biosynthesis polyprenyl glycosylphosphotransferase
VVVAQTERGSADIPRMHHYGAHRFVIFSIIMDFMMACCAAAVAFWVRFQLMKEVGYFQLQTMDEYIVHLILGSTTLVAILAWRGVYRREMLLQYRRTQRQVIKGVILWTLGFLLMALAFHIEPPISRIFMAVNGLVTLPILLIWRSWFNHQLHKPERLAALKQRAIVIGDWQDAGDLQRRFSENPEEAVELVGWVRTGELVKGLNPKVPCLGTLEDLENVLAQHPSDMVILADLSGPREQSVQIANLCEREMIGFKIIPSCFRIFQSGLQLETVAGTPVVGVSSLPLDNSFNVVLKRMVDIVGAIVGLLLSAPIMLLFGMLVYLESRGPIFYRQRRTGANGQPFYIIKIRSMRLDAEKNGAQWCKEDDPRRLRVGEFMRKWNIDEVPQFWNVLKGEMSLVGPRPERPELISGFKYQIPHYNARHHAKPGMTGWAQVNGLRGDTSLTDRIKADLWYLENWNLLLDFQVMLMTFMKRQNAY